MEQQLRDIEYFSVVAEHGNLGRAAETLGLSQPALSKSLRRLETAMKAKLVQRTFKGVELTGAGVMLFEQVRRLRLSLDDVTRSVTELGQGRAGHLRIGVGPAVAMDLVPRACAALLRDAPGVTFQVTVGDNNTSTSAVRHGLLDFAIATIWTSHYSDLAVEQISEEDFCLYVAKNHPLARKKHVALADLAPYSWAITGNKMVTHSRVNQVFMDANLPAPNITIHTNFLPLKHRLVASSNLIGYTARHVIKQVMPRSRFVELPVKELTWVRQIGVYYRKEAYLSPTARRFIDILKFTAKAMAGGK
jgi:DNA-binding transcriptional LysR family regulator